MKEVDLGLKFVKTILYDNHDIIGNLAPACHTGNLPNYHALRKPRIGSDFAKIELAKKRRRREKEGAQLS